MASRNRHPKIDKAKKLKGSTEQTKASEEALDTGKELTELAWGMNMAEQTTGVSKKQILDVLCEVDDEHCQTEEDLEKQGFKAIEFSVFHPDDLLITNMKTGEVKLDEGMLGHFADRYIDNFTSEGLKKGVDWDIALRDDGTYVICTKREG